MQLQWFIVLKSKHEKYLIPRSKVYWLWNNFYSQYKRKIKFFYKSQRNLFSYTYTQKHTLAESRAIFFLHNKYFLRGCFKYNTIALMNIFPILIMEKLLLGVNKNKIALIFFNLFLFRIWFFSLKSKNIKSLWRLIVASFWIASQLALLVLIFLFEDFYRSSIFLVCLRKRK